MNISMMNLIVICQVVLATLPNGYNYSMAGLVAGFSIGLGAIPWLIASEIVPLRV